METRRKGEMRTKMNISHICFLILAVLQIIMPIHPVLMMDASAQNTTTTSSTVSTTGTSALGYRTRPADVRVALGEPAVFRCGVPAASPTLSFAFYGGHGNYSLTCPGGHVEDIPQALYGSCDIKDGESLAVWTLKGTSLSDNGTRVVCRKAGNPDVLTAVLYLYDNGMSYATLIGCTIGGLFGILLVLALSYSLLWRSEKFQKCFRRRKTEDDMITIVTKDKRKTES